MTSRMPTVRSRESAADPTRTADRASPHRPATPSGSPPAVLPTHGCYPPRPGGSPAEDEHGGRGYRARSSPKGSARSGVFAGLARSRPVVPVRARSVRIDEMSLQVNIASSKMGPVAVGDPGGRSSTPRRSTSTAIPCPTGTSNRWIEAKAFVDVHLTWDLGTRALRPTGRGIGSRAWRGWTPGDARAHGRERARASGRIIVRSCAGGRILRGTRHTW